MKNFQFKIQQEVLDLGVKIKGVRIHGINNTVYSSSLNEYIDVHVKRLLENNTLDTLKENQIIQGFYDLHKEVGIPKRKNLPASENLLKNLLKKQEFHKINPLVDIYNLISMDTKLALGAHDLAKTEGNISLKLTTGNENYIPLGSEEAKVVKAGIYSYIDDANDIICFSEIRQVDKTKVTNESEDIFFIVQGNKVTSNKYVEDVAKELNKDVKEIEELININFKVSSLNSKVDNNECNKKSEFQDSFGYEVDFDTNLYLKYLFEVLTEREKNMIIEQFFKNTPQKDIANKHNISQAQVSRIIKGGLAKMRKVG